MRASSFAGHTVSRAIAYTAIRRFKIKRYPTYTHPARVTNTAVRRATGQVSTRPDGDHGRTRSRRRISSRRQPSSGEERESRLS